MPRFKQKWLITVLTLIFRKKIWFQLKRLIPMAHDLIVCKRRPKSEVGWGGGRREAEIREKMAPYEEMRQFSFTLSKIPAHLFHGP